MEYRNKAHKWKPCLNLLYTLLQYIVSEAPPNAQAVLACRILFYCHPKRLNTQTEHSGPPPKCTGIYDFLFVTENGVESLNLSNLNGYWDTEINLLKKKQILCSRMFGENLHILLSGLRWFSPSLSCHLLPSIAISRMLIYAGKTWVCLKIGYIPNYSHLIGIMIINHWV